MFENPMTQGREGVGNIQKGDRPYSVSLALSQEVLERPIFFLFIFKGFHKRGC